MPVRSFVALASGTGGSFVRLIKKSLISFWIVTVISDIC